MSQPTTQPPPAFLDARTHNAWQPKDVPDSLLRELVDTLKMGPTSANCRRPLRVREVEGGQGSSSRS